jgi:transposase
VLRLADVDDIETLRRAALVLESENKKLIQLIAKLKRELTELKGGAPEQLSLQIAELEEQLAQRNRMLFGDKSEKRSTRPKEEKPAEPQRGHGPRAQLELKVIEQVHLLDEADKACPKCGGELKAWQGQFEESEEIDVIERQFVLKKHKRTKYRCGCGECIETALGPVKLFAGARYSVDFAVGVALSKYGDHLPLERQVKIMGREGLRIDSQTLWDQIERLAGVLAPAYDRLPQYLMTLPVLGADETHWRLMGTKDSRGSPSKRWQVWTMAGPDAVYYRIQGSRSTEAARVLLGGFRGTVLCDGYTAYEKLSKEQTGLQLAHCWAHVRRKYVEIEEAFPTQVQQILTLIAELYAIEQRCPTGPAGDDLRRDLRDQHSRGIVKRIEQWALETRALPQSGLGKAVAYMGGMWKGLQRFLDDPAVPVDNNATERALRGVVVGRKNHYGSRSQRGTEVAALFYSLIESAKLAGVGPHTYLRSAAYTALRGGSVALPHEMG